jgi:TonB family protein
MRKLFILSALLLAACGTPAPQPEAAAPASPPAHAPAPARAEEAPPVTAAAPAAEAAEPTPTGPVEVAYTQAPLPGHITAEQVEKTFRLHQRYFSRAYRDRLHSRAALAGTVTVGFTIRPDGTVEGAQLLESTTRDAAFDARVVGLVAGMNFPPATAPTPVARYPLVFTPPAAKEPVKK